MTWQSVARKDFADAARSRVVLVLGALFVLLFIVTAWFAGSFDGFIDDAFTNLDTLVPVLAIVLGYKAVIHERESGSLRLSLSFPHSRRAFLLGKFVGRSLVLLVPVVVALAVAGVVATINTGSLHPVRYVAFTTATALYGISFLAIALAISMSTTSSRRVLAGVIGAYILLAILWGDLATLTAAVVYRFRLDLIDDLPTWAVVLETLSPREVYLHLTHAVFEVGNGSAHLTQDTPWYLNQLTVATVGVAWIAAPLALGYRWFDRADL